MRDILLARLLRQNVFLRPRYRVKCQLPGPPTVHSSQSLPLVPRDLYGASDTFGHYARFRPADFWSQAFLGFTPRTTLFAGAQALLRFQPVRGFLFRLFTPTGVSPTLGGPRSGSISLLRRDHWSPTVRMAWWRSFSAHDAAVPAFILGRGSLRPAAFVLYHVPRVFLRVEVSSPPSLLHVLSPPSVRKFTYFSVYFGSTCLST